MTGRQSGELRPDHRTRLLAYPASNVDWYAGCGGEGLGIDRKGHHVHVA